MNTELGYRARTASAKLALARCVFDYDPSQRRAEDGRWTGGSGLLSGFATMEADAYEKMFGDVLDEANVESGGSHDWSVRIFESGDAHLVVDAPSGSFQPLKRLDADSMRVLAADIESILDLDIDDYGDDAGDESGVVDSTHDAKHNWSVSLDADGDIRVHPEGDESSAYIHMSDDAARSLVEALEEMAGVHDNTDFEDDGDEEDE